MRRPNRWFGIIGIAAERLRYRILTRGGRRLLLSVLGVALAIALVVTVTGVSVGLATGTTVYSEDVDYWLVPESASTSTMAVSVGGPAFGAVHPTNEQIESLDGVQAATPVSVNTVRASNGENAEYIILLGVIPREGLTVVGADTSQLRPGDPFYANGTFQGEWTGEALISPATAKLLNLSTGDSFTVSGSQRSLTVLGEYESDGASGMGSVPTAVLHLSEAQSLADQTESDAADQFLVQTDSPAVGDQLTSIYPESTLVSRSSGGVQAVSSADLPLAIALGGFLISLIVGSLFVATAMGMEVAGDSRRFATLNAMGFSTRSLLGLVAVETLLVTVVGGILGVGLGWGTIHLANRLARRWLTEEAIAVFDSLFLPYGIGIAVGMGLLTLPYLAWLTNRTWSGTRLTA